MTFTAAEFMELIEKQAFAGIKPAPVKVFECYVCNGLGTTDAGRCVNCAGRGRVATDGGEA